MCVCVLNSFKQFWYLMYKLRKYFIYYFFFPESTSAFVFQNKVKSWPCYSFLLFVESGHIILSFLSVFVNGCLISFLLNFIP